MTEAAPVAAPVESAEPAETTDAAPERTTLQEATQTFAEKMKAARAAKKAGRDALAKVAGDAAEPEKPKAAKPGDVEELTADALFASEALGTPEGIERAREVLTFAKEHLEKRHRRFDRADLALKDREAKVTGLENERKRLQGLAQAFRGELQTITGMRESDPLGILRAVDRIAGGNGSIERGRELFEAMSMAYAREGKLPEKTRGERELETRLERMERERQEERKRFEDEQQATTIAQARQQIAQLEAFAGKQANDAAKFPIVAATISEGRWTEADIGTYIGNLMEAQPGLDLSSAIGILESRLAPLGAKRAPDGESVSDETESSRVAAPARKNGARQSTVLPSDADLSSGTSRKETDEQRRERLARDPKFLKRLGLPGLA